MTTFNVLRKSDCGHWHVVEGFKPFNNPALANETAKALTRDTGDAHRIQAIILADNAWKVREQNRIAAGHYTMPPWCQQAINIISHGNERFPHLSEKVGGKIAYTESVEKGQRDIQTPLSVVRYLTKYHKHNFSDKHMADLSALCGSTTLELITDTDDIVAAYLSGPSSCMSKPTDYYSNTHIHPTSVYGGASDLALMVMRRDGDITARCIVWPAKKRYTTIYGDVTRMKAEFESEGGWSGGGSMSGAKLNKIAVNDTYVCAFLDGEQSIDVMADHLMIGGSEYEAVNHESGTLTAGEQCCNCGTSYDPEESYTTEQGDSYCGDCYHELYSYCENCDETVSIDDMVYIENAETHVCSYCADTEYPSCDQCHDRSKADDIHTTANGETVCLGCLESGDFAECHTCGDIHPADDITYTDDGAYCDDCKPEETDDDDATPTTSLTVQQPNQMELNI